MRHEEPLAARHRVIPAQAGIQGHPQRTAVKEKADLLRLTEWVDQGLYDQPEAVALYQQLAASLGEQHPQLQRLQRSRLRQKALKS